MFSLLQLLLQELLEIGHFNYLVQAGDFTKYVCNKLIKMLRLHYDELIWKTEEHEGEKKLMVDDHMLDRVLDKIIKK